MYSVCECMCHSIRVEVRGQTYGGWLSYCVGAGIELRLSGLSFFRHVLAMHLKNCVCVCALVHVWRPESLDVILRDIV